MPMVPGYIVERVPLPARLGPVEGVYLSDAGHVGVQYGPRTGERYAERAGVAWRGEFTPIPGRKVRLAGIAADGTVGGTEIVQPADAAVPSYRRAFVLQGARRSTWDFGAILDTEVLGVRPGGVALVRITPTIQWYGSPATRLGLGRAASTRDVGVGDRGVFGDDGAVYGTYQEDARGRPVVVGAPPPFRRISYRWRDGVRQRISVLVQAARGRYRLEAPSEGGLIALRGRGVYVSTGIQEPGPPSDDPRAPYLLGPGPSLFYRGSANQTWSKGRWRTLNLGGYLADVNSQGWLLVNGEDGRSVYVLKPK